MQSCSVYKEKHQNLGVEWALSNLKDVAREWKSIIFPDDKKFNVSKVDGLNYYWHDLRRPREKVEKSPTTRDSVIVWRAICYNGSVVLEGAERTMAAQYYTSIISEGLISVVDDTMGDVWTLQQDNASIHPAHHTRSWLEKNDVHVLNWLAQS